MFDAEDRQIMAMLAIRAAFMGGLVLYAVLLLAGAIRLFEVLT